jgi:hypothetical protein
MLALSIVIVTYNSGEDIIPCLDSIERTKGDLNIEIIVVDNNSIDGTVEIVRRRYPEVYFITNDYNVGFPRANNQAIVLTKGKYVLLLNPDTIVKPGAFQAMIEFMEETPSCGVCGPRLIERNGVDARNLLSPGITSMFIRIVEFGIGLRLMMPKHKKQTDYVSGAALLFPIELTKKIGLLDNDLWWAEDVDFCTRAKQNGFVLAIVPSAKIIHHVGGSAKTNIAYSESMAYLSKLRYCWKYGAPSWKMIVLSVLMILEVSMRLTKWVLIHTVHPSTISKSRCQGFVNIISTLPRMLKAMMNTDR